MYGRCCTGPGNLFILDLLRVEHNIEGVVGIRVWQGGVARDEDAVLKAWFAPAITPEQHLALAWYLEEGNRQLYHELAQREDLPSLTGLMTELGVAEERHQATLVALYQGIAGVDAVPDFPVGILAEVPEETMLEGGMTLAEVREWGRDKAAADILELGMAMELNAYDRYLLLRRQAEDESVRRAFEVVSDEEKHHLERLSAVYEENL